MAALFSPLTLAKVTFPNRIVVSPMCQYSAPAGEASDWHMVHLGQYALSGAGLLMIEATAVEPAGRITPSCLCLYTDRQEAALARVVAVCRNLGDGPIGVQLAHAGRKGSCHLPWHGGHGLAAEEGAWTIYGPSPIAYDASRAVPEALDGAGMGRIRAAFVAAAKRADRIGLDLVEYHCAHGYLVHSFLSPVTNRRQDAYGGTIENRMRFPLEVARALREAWPAHKVLGARVNSADHLAGGMVLSDTVAYVRALKAIGFDYVCISTGSLIGGQTFDPKPGYLLPDAAVVRAETGIATQAVGMIVDPQAAEAAVASGQVDMVALARAFIDDPRWVWHAAEALAVPFPYRPQYRSVDPATWKGAALRAGRGRAA